MLHQQLWCWGRDVRATPNWLVDFGMTRHAGPTGADGAAGSTRYVATLSCGTTITLWAFGIAIADGRGVFVDRYRRGLRITPTDWNAAAVGSPESLPRMRRPHGVGEVAHAAELLDRLLRWIESYERWIATRADAGHRGRTLERWEHPVVDADAMADAWRTLAADHRRARAAHAPRLRTVGGPTATCVSARFIAANRSPLKACVASTLNRSRIRPRDVGGGR